MCLVTLELIYHEFVLNPLPNKNGGAQSTSQPPSTSTAVPCTSEASSPARKTATLEITSGAESYQKYERMRRSGAWMTIWNNRILEIARKEDSVSPKELADTGYFAVSRTQIARRLKKLNEHGLVQHLENGVYIVTDRGEGYLDGEISTYEDEPDEIRENGGEENNDGVPSPGGI